MYLDRLNEKTLVLRINRADDMNAIKAIMRKGREWGGTPSSKTGSKEIIIRFKDEDNSERAEREMFDVMMDFGVFGTYVPDPDEPKPDPWKNVVENYLRTQGKI